jgi:RHS repeat-associated protein
MERDEETGLSHHGARYYAPWLGRWTASDPIGIGDGVNRYAYVKGNPVGMRDVGGNATEDTIQGSWEASPDALGATDPWVSTEFYTGRLSGLADATLEHAQQKAAEATRPKQKPAQPKKQERQTNSERGPSFIEKHFGLDAPPAENQGAAIRQGASASTISHNLLGMHPILAPNVLLAKYGLGIELNLGEEAVDAAVGEASERGTAEYNASQAVVSDTAFVADLAVQPARGVLNRVREIFAERGGPKLRTLYHYTDAPEESFKGGLWSHTSATDDAALTAQEAVEQLGVKRAPDKIIPVRDRGHFVPNKPHIVEPHPLGPGGGKDFMNPRKVPPEDILPARPVRAKRK